MPIRALLNKDTLLPRQFSIKLANAHTKGNYIAIDPSQIIISRELMTSSMRNHFQGQIIMIDNSADSVRLCVEAGEKFEILITTQAREEL